MAGTTFKGKKAPSLAPWEGEQGFTLLELMVALAVSTIVIGTVSLTMINASRSVIAVRQDSLTNSLLSNLSQILRDTQLCSAAFIKTNPGPVDVPLDVNPAAWAANAPLHISKIVLNGATLAEEGKRTGGDLNGTMVSSMTFDNPALVAGARYRWSLKIRTDKVDAQGNILLGGSQIHNFRVTITTNDGSPNYNVVSCGIELREPLSIPPPPIVMGRSLLTIAQANTVTVAPKTRRDAECNAIGSDYVPATLLDLVQVNAAPGNHGVISAGGGAQPFLVQDDTANAYTLLHPPSTAAGMEIHNLGATSGQVACVHRTAPIRFTSSTALGANFNPTAGPAAHNLECNKAFGPNYVAASYFDLFPYGFAEVPANDIPAGGGELYRDVTLEGTPGNTCRIAYLTTGGSALGPVIDCTQAPTPEQIGCVVRSN